MPSPQDNNILTVLQDGQLTIRGEFVWGSNYTFLTQVELEGQTISAVYKPTRGERPLWDFPRASLAWREVAAYRVSNALGWELVPPTVYRKDGPAGPGSLQMFVEHDPEYHYFNLTDADKEKLTIVAVFDILINNADRKGSHIIFDPDGHLWLIDHGISFHREDKLRTVVWDFAGDPIPPELLADLGKFQRDLKNNTSLVTSLQECLSRLEVTAMSKRAGFLSGTGIFPTPDPNRRVYPWPAL
jgi:uncharacterized repeat protein (TIGR03843 family)